MRHPETTLSQFKRRGLRNHHIYFSPDLGDRRGLFYTLRPGRGGIGEYWSPPTMTQQEIALHNMKLHNDDRRSEEDKKPHHKQLAEILTPDY